VLPAKVMRRRVASVTGVRRVDGSANGSPLLWRTGWPPQPVC